FMNISMSYDYAGDQLFWANIVRAVGQALVMTPLSAVAAAGIEAEHAGSASGLFNMTRNLGGAIGIAALQTLITKREQFHSNVLMNSVSVFSEATRQRIADLTQYFLAHGVTDIAIAHHQAIIVIGRIVRRESFVMSYSDVFLLLGIGLVLGLLAMFGVRKASGGSAAGAH
ncbi:MAG TPA: EmrB/QacA family drug resistance transporter, partial [Dongiaceae bacterium]